MTIDAYIALGSNLGSRVANLLGALNRLESQPNMAIVATSSIYQTAPVGGPPGQRQYKNTVCRVSTNLPAPDLMETLLSIESDMGRKRNGTRNSPRKIDLDILLYGNSVINETGLIVPHPRMEERFFVLRPLQEIAPEVVHPIHGQTVTEMLEALENKWMSSAI